MKTIEECLTFLLGKAQQHAQQIAKARLQPYGVTPVQYALLHLLFEKDGQQSSELGDRLRLDSATMTGLLDRLVQNGFIERHSNPKDRRVNRIYLTNRSIELQGILYEKMQEAHSEALKGFTEEETVLLKSMLARIGLEKAKI
ncbi:MarR family winged helix-turn-helix transcriptional regulator [Bacillus songklensis]|uniref:MarR family winged helix-turn-helix transcriptional regulator n=1 Tax=Bacillus songklensis TaxID=1069116 RepID=A0ABV8B6Q7_9BACI